MQEGGSQKAAPKAPGSCSKESSLLQSFLLQKATQQSTTLTPNWQQPRQRDRRGHRLSLKWRMSRLIASIFQLLLRLLEQQGYCCAGRSWPCAGPPTSNSPWRCARQGSMMLSKTGA
ncbi:unnamed protein product [Bubo scandiacus]